MTPHRIPTKLLATLIFVFATSLLYPKIARAHCDTVNGPVVTDARKALEASDVTPVLKWIAHEDEDEVRVSFERTQIVRQKGPEARELADLYFFETVVRLHRASEGMPYTGLKPATTDVGPAVAAADNALETGSLTELSGLLLHEIEAEVAGRFEQARQARAHADHNVEAGRAYVRAYVSFVHLAEHLHEVTSGTESPAVKNTGTHTPASPLQHAH